MKKANRGLRSLTQQRANTSWISPSSHSPSSSLPPATPIHDRNIFSSCWVPDAHVIFQNPALQQRIWGEIHQPAFFFANNTCRLWRGNALGDSPGHTKLRTASPGLTTGWKKMRGHATGITGTMSQDRKSLVNAPGLWGMTRNLPSTSASPASICPHSFHSLTTQNAGQ